MAYSKNPLSALVTNRLQGEEREREVKAAAALASLFKKNTKEDSSVSNCNSRILKLSTFPADGKKNG